jgi:hypothetical protein
MPEAGTFGLFLTAALVLAITPGPGIFYVLTRSLKGGRAEREPHHWAMPSVVSSTFSRRRLASRPS